jgi:hypothetical protein
VSLTTAKYLFVIIGSAMLLGGVLAYSHTASFIHRADSAYGTVTALVPRISNDNANTNGAISNTTKYSWQPVVQFKHGAQLIQFTDSLATNPPAYNVGETVNVLYLEEDPYDAKIESFMSLWFSTMFFGGLGAIFLAVGTGMIVRSRPGAAH